jgi:DNA-binding transcriptional LysR family regulator
MDRIEMMRAFREVARREAFSPAARQLGVSASALSRHIAGLEDWLGVQLFHRTTRHVRLTDAGQGYLARCSKILDSVRELEETGSDTTDKLSGTIRLTAPNFYGRHYVVPIVQDFLRCHPDMTVELILYDRVVDVVGEGFDLAVRITKPEDSSLIARSIGSTSVVHVASPDYLKQNGVPELIEDLASHACIVDQVPGYVGHWPFKTQKGLVSQRVDGRIKVNDGEMARDFAIAGFGIARLPGFFVDDAIASGEVVPVLEDIYHDEAGIYIVYPPSRFVSRSLRVLIDTIVDGLKPG